jgi:hypothetical protein
MTFVKLEDLPELVLASTTLLYGEKSPYTTLSDAGKIPLSLLDARYIQVAGDTMTGNLDMGDQNIINIGHTVFDLDHADTPDVGELQWNNTDGTLEVGALGGNVILQIGQESHLYAVQQTGETIPNGRSVIVIGASGQRPEIVPTNLAAGNPIDLSIGITTETILNNQRGYVTMVGIVRGLNTSMWSEGDVLWVDGTTPGMLTNVRPTAPLRPVLIGVVVTSNISTGSIFVNPLNVFNLSLLADVYVPATPNDGDYLRWSAANSRWELSAT